MFLHGVDAVYKYPPYELYPDPGRPWNFSAADASLMARLGFNVVRLGITWSGLEPGRRRPTTRPSVTRGSPATRTSSARSILEPLHRPPADDGAPPGPVPHLHHPRHAPGRVQRDVRGGRRAELGRLHRRRSQRRSARSLVSGLRHDGGRHRLLPFLEEQRPRRPAGSVRPRLGRRGPCFPLRPVGARLRSLQRAVLDRPGPFPRPAFRRPTRVLLHRPGPRGRTFTRCSAPALPLGRSRSGA